MKQTILSQLEPTPRNAPLNTTKKRFHLVIISSLTLAILITALGTGALLYSRTGNQTNEVASNITALSPMPSLSPTPSPSPIATPNSSVTLLITSTTTPRFTIDLVEAKLSAVLSDTVGDFQLPSPTSPHSLIKGINERNESVFEHQIYLPPHQQGTTVKISVPLSSPIQRVQLLTAGGVLLTERIVTTETTVTQAPPTAVFNTQTTKLATLPTDFGTIRIDTFGNNFAYSGTNDPQEGTFLYSKNWRKKLTATYVSDISFSPLGNHVLFVEPNYTEGSIFHIDEEPYPAAIFATFSPNDQRRALLIHEPLTKEEVLGPAQESAAASCQGNQECLTTYLAYVEATYEDNKGTYFRQYLIIDGQPTEKFYEVSGVTFSPDSNDIVWAAKNQNDDWSLYRNGTKVRDLPKPIRRGHYEYNFNLEKFATELKEIYSYYNQQPCDINCLSGNLETLVVSSDGKHQAWVSNYEQVVRDGQPQQRYDGIHELIFSPNSQHLMYRAAIFQGEVSARNALVVDGKKRTPNYKDLRDRSFSPDSTLFAYAYQETNDAPHFVEVSDFGVNSIWKSPPHEKVVGNVVFSPDNTYVGYGVVKNNELWWIAEKIR